MAITVSFTVSQTVGSPAAINIVDTSTGSDVTAAGRRIYITNQAGQYLTTGPTLSSTSAYTDWPIADGNSLTIDSILSEDMALNVRLTYVTSGGATVSTDVSLEGFTLYNETFYYTLTQAQAQQNQPPPMIIQDSNYYMNKTIFRTNIDSGNQAISLGGDITSAQNCYSLATYMRLKENDYF